MLPVNADDIRQLRCNIMPSCRRCRRESVRFQRAVRCRSAPVRRTLGHIMHQFVRELVAVNLTDRKSTLARTLPSSKRKIGDCGDGGGKATASLVSGERRTWRFGKVDGRHCCCWQEQVFNGWMDGGEEGVRCRVGCCSGGVLSGADVMNVQPSRSGQR